MNPDTTFQGPCTAGARDRASSPGGSGAGPSARRGAYNARLIDQASDAAMEAEQLNSIENRIDDIAGRAGELRRYL